VSRCEPGCAGHARWDRVLPPTLARRGGPWSRAEVPENRVFRLAFRSWKPDPAASQAPLQRSVRGKAAGPPRHAVPCPRRRQGRRGVAGGTADRLRRPGRAARPRRHRRPVRRPGTGGAAGRPGRETERLRRFGLTPRTGQLPVRDGTSCLKSSRARKNTANLMRREPRGVENRTINNMITGGLSPSAARPCDCRKRCRKFDMSNNRTMTVSLQSEDIIMSADISDGLLSPRTRRII
jgi:hypothetical protein